MKTAITILFNNERYNDLDDVKIKISPEFECKSIEFQEDILHDALDLLRVEYENAVLRRKFK